MTGIDLDAIRARVEATSPGPWTPYFTIHGDPYVAEEGRGLFGLVVSTATRDYGRANCEFIAHARTDVPALLDALDAAHQENARLLELVEQGKHAYGELLIEMADLRRETGRWEGV